MGQREGEEGDQSHVLGGLLRAEYVGVVKKERALPFRDYKEYGSHMLFFSTLVYSSTLFGAKSRYEDSNPRMG